MTETERLVLDELVHRQERVKWDEVLQKLPGLTKLQCINYVNSKRNPRKEKTGFNSARTHSNSFKNVLASDSVHSLSLSHKSALNFCDNQSDQKIPESMICYFTQQGIELLEKRSISGFDDALVMEVRYLLFMMQTDAFFEHKALQAERKNPVLNAVFFFQNHYSAQQIIGARNYSQIICPHFHIFEKYGGVPAHPVIYNMLKSIEHVKIAQIALQIQFRLQHVAWVSQSIFQGVVESVLDEDLVICEAVQELLQTFKAQEILQRRVTTHLQHFGHSKQLNDVVGVLVQ